MSSSISPKAPSTLSVLQSMNMNTMPQTIPADTTPTITPVNDPLSPLARAALALGLDFDDVDAFVMADHNAHADVSKFMAVLGPEAWQRAEKVELAGRTYNAPNYAREVIADMVLDAALLKSVLGTGSITAARLWWQGVL